MADPSQTPIPDTEGATAPSPAPVPSIAELIRVALLVGVVGFGGGISVLGIVETLAVVRRRWLTQREFTHMTTVAQMLPGGAAANALAMIGLRFHGVAGAAATYIGFVTPGALSIVALAWFYVRFGTVPNADAFLSGLNAAVVGVILAIAVRMLRTSVTRFWQMAVAGGALLLSMVGGAGSGEVVLMSIGAGLGMRLGGARVRRLVRRRGARTPVPVALPEEGTPLEPAPAEAPPMEQGEPPARGGGSGAIMPALLVLAATPAIAHVARQLLSFAVVFFRTGLGAYGGGFAIIPALQAQVVDVHHWLTERQFADAVAVGKLTPGPVLLMVTFIGYLKAGLAGALVSTVAILSAPFVLVVALTSWLEQVRSNKWVRSALRGLTPGVLGLMVAAALTLGSSLKTGVGAAIAAIVALTLIRFERVNPVALLVLGGVARLVFHLAGG